MSSSQGQGLGQFCSQCLPSTWNSILYIIGTQYIFLEWMNEWMNEWISDKGCSTYKGRAPGLPWLFLPGTWPLLQVQETFSSCFLTWFLNFHLFSGHTQHPEAWGPRAFISNKPLSRSLALSSVSCPNVQTKHRCKTLEAGLSFGVLPTPWMSWILFLVSKAPAQVLTKEG